MSEEIKRMSAFEAFAQTQLTFAEAEEKAKQEAGTPRVERFRIGEDGEYPIRILPLAPSFDAEGNILPMERKGYEYALHQLFLGIKVPAKKGGKSKKISIPVIRTTDKEVGFSIDLIDTYVKIAKEMYADDEELIKLIGSNSYSGGLRWNYQHAMMVLDVSNDKERAKGPQIWQCSHSQYKDIDAAKMRLWREEHDEGRMTCPISGLTDAYPVKIIRSNNSNKTEYKVEIGRKTLDLNEAEVEKLLELPRIPEQIYRYTRYQMEATLAFLAQYDKEHGMEVCEEPDFKEAVAKLTGELSPEDNSHFDLSGATIGGSESKADVTINSLWNEYDAICDQDLGERSEEYQELREKIRQYIEDKKLDVRISRTKTNQQILEEVQEAEEEAAKTAKVVKDEPEEKPVRRTPAPKPAEADEEEEEPVEEQVDEETGEITEVRTRRPRPVADAEEAPAEEVANEAKSEDAPAEQEDAPRRRLRTTRFR